MTAGSIKEYATAMRKRYLAASKKEKSKLLSEFCAVTRYHRKAAVRLLRRPPGKTTGRGRAPQYGLAVTQALRKLWEAGDHLCSKRLAPFIPELVDALERHGELSLGPGVRELVLRVSASTIDRLLRPYRRRGLRRPHSPYASPSSIKAKVPIRTFSEWENVQPGSLQADLVLHCGEGTQGFYLSTLTTVDVATGWLECRAIWGKGKERVGGGVYHVQRRLPFPLRELHTDNGSEFINDALYPYCQRNGIHFTRGRPYKKNDQAYVEQRNWSVVRRLVGYHRYSTKAAYAQMERLYLLVGQYFNFFQPMSKLVAKERIGAKVTKRYDLAKTPYQRLLETGVLEEAKRRSLEQEYQSLNPVHLKSQIDAALEALWKLAEPEATRSYTSAGSTETETDKDFGNTSFEATS